MTYIWDTNILLYSVSEEVFLEKLNKRFDIFNPLNTNLISAVTIGEIYSIALRNRWGSKRMSNLAQKLKLVTPIPVTDDLNLIQMYAEIDVYSQNQHPSLKMTTSARKMGKNDLWIAATTAIYNATLLSSDLDFEHLDGLFLYFEKIVV
jgi:tRNA(fMet)-specific endonuclease VapC